MYKIIGADGKEYGPVSVDQIRQWAAAGRINAQTLIQPEGSTDWKAAANFPDLLPPVAPPVMQPLQNHPTTKPPGADKKNRRWTMRHSSRRVGYP